MKRENEANLSFLQFFFFSSFFRPALETPRFLDLFAHELTLVCDSIDARLGEGGFDS